VSAARDIEGHYSRGDLLDRLAQALIDDGVDPSRPSVDALAPYDQFHGRGMEATREIADRLAIAPTDRILDVGSGIGGPARYIAHRFGCRVFGIDLTAEFCSVARALSRRLGLEGQVTFTCGTALALPFANACFEGAYSMNVSMNIDDKRGFYAEIHRVLAPGGWLLLSEIARGPRDGLAFPTPWARDARMSFLSTPEETRHGLALAGFEVLGVRSTLDEALAFGARSRAMVERGEKPPHRAVRLIHGDIAKAAMANTAHGLVEGQIVPIEVLARKTR
jgi:SAM-dependent methyltransferase